MIYSLRNCSRFLAIVIFVMGSVRLLNKPYREMTP